VRDGYVQKSEKRYSVVENNTETAREKESEEPPVPSYPDPEPPEEPANSYYDPESENSYYDPEPDCASCEEPEDYDLPPGYPPYDEELDNEEGYLLFKEQTAERDRNERTE
jgi:hypothetical protein